MTECPRDHCHNQAVQHKLYGVLPCQNCQESDTQLSVRQAPEFYSLTKQHRIVSQRDQFAKDILQPYQNDKPNPQFVKAYPEYRKKYFAKEQLRNI